jgi:hypothetical protein
LFCPTVGILLAHLDATRIENVGRCSQSVLDRLARQISYSGDTVGDRPSVPAVLIPTSLNNLLARRGLTSGRLDPEEEQRPTKVHYLD